MSLKRLSRWVILAKEGNLAKVNAKHFTSWLTLSPGCKISGRKVLSAHTRKTSSRLTVALRLAAVNVGRSNTALGAFYRRLASRIGKAKAVTATARKIAVLFYNAIRYGMGWIIGIQAQINMSNNIELGH